MKIYSYVVDHDEGREPNPYFNVCTLCRCKFSKKAEATQGREGRKNIVELACKGDWVIGTGGTSKKSAGHGKLIYAMQVDERLTRWEYFTDRRFIQKKPERPRSEFERHKQFALVSWHFYYFGANAIDIPKRFRLEKPKGFRLEKKGPGFRSHFEPADILRFLEWLKRECKPGKHGKPCGKVVDELKGSRRCKSSC